MLTTDYKIAFVTVLKAQADAATQTFLAALITCTTARIQSTQTGRALIGSSSNGKTVSYAMPGNAGALSEVAIAELCGELIRRYGEAKQRLTAAGTVTIDDAAIYAELLGYLVPITEMETDYSELRSWGGR